MSNVQAQDRAIRLEIEVNAPVQEVWKKWTTEEGAKTFFAPECTIELKPMGLYQMIWFKDKPAGQRGAEDVRILAIQENKMFSFTWDAPPNYPELKKHRTSVVLRFKEVPKNKTIISLIHSGWGEGADWDGCFLYFVSAWSDQVLPYLKYSLEKGPINWENRPLKSELGGIVFHEPMIAKKEK